MPHSSYSPATPSSNHGAGTRRRRLGRRQQPFPHQQLTQTAPIGLQEELFARVLTLPGVSTGDSCVSVPGARAFILDPRLPPGPRRPSSARPSSPTCTHPATAACTSPRRPTSTRQCRPPAGRPHPISGTMLVRSPRRARTRDRLADRARVVPLRPGRLAGHRAGNTYRRRFWRLG